MLPRAGTTLSMLTGWLGTSKARCLRTWDMDQQHCWVQRMLHRSFSELPKLMAENWQGAVFVYAKICSPLDCQCPSGFNNDLQTTQWGTQRCFIHFKRFDDRRLQQWNSVYGTVVDLCWEILKGSVERSLLPWAIFLIFTRNRPWKSEDHLCACFLLKYQRKD